MRKTTTTPLLIITLFLTIEMSFTRLYDDDNPLGANDNDKRSRIERCRRDIICSDKDVNGPAICGNNGRTYENPCEFHRIACLGKSVEMHSVGHCPAIERCQLEREFQLRLNKSNYKEFNDLFVPQCDPVTKLYSHIQCYNQTGYCWCQTHFGTPVPSTAVEISDNMEMSCPTHTLHVDLNGSISEHHIFGNYSTGKCGTMEKLTYNSNMLEIFRRQYSQLTTRTGTDVKVPQDRGMDNDNDDDIVNAFADTRDIGGDDDSRGRGSVIQESSFESEERRLLTWKFKWLDTDYNDRISRDELEEEKRLTLLIVPPVTCSVNFYERCDKNSDKLIDLQEWIACLQIDIRGLRNDFSDKPHDDVRDLYSNQVIQAPTKKSGNITCQIARQLVIEENKNSDIPKRVPSCRTDNPDFYESMQCNNKTCWCVNATTGMVTVSGHVNSSRECRPRNKFTQVRIKDCNKIDQLYFYRVFFRLLRREYAAENPTISSPRRMGYKALAKWKFNQLDTNHDTIVDRREWREFRQQLRQKIVGKCARNLMRSCDVEKNGNLSEREWIECTHKTFRLMRKYPMNPFLHLLKPEN